MNGDTIINTLTYHKIITSEWWSEFNSVTGNCYDNYFYMGTGGYFGAIRQDTLQKKIYCLNDTIETLLYDFSLNIGDTIPRFGGTVSSIDSILIGSNYRKRFNHSIIEGIGSTQGLIERMTIDCGGSLHCFSQSNQSLYPNFGMTCNFECPNCIIGLNEPFKKNGILISPNPASSNLLIETTQLPYSVKIFNTVGQEVFSKENIHEPAANINISALKDGILFVNIITQKETFHYKALKQ